MSDHQASPRGAKPETPPLESVPMFGVALPRSHEEIALDDAVIAATAPALADLADTLFAAMTDTEEQTR